MRACAYDQGIFLEFFCLCDGQIVLSKVQAISVRGDRDIGAVVYYAYDAGFFAEFYEFYCCSEEFVVGHIFCTQLDAVGTTCDAAIGQEDYVSGQIACYDDVQICRFEFFRRFAEEHDILFEGVR